MPSPCHLIVIYYRRGQHTRINLGARFLENLDKSDEFCFDCSRASTSWWQLDSHACASVSKRVISHWKPVVTVMKTVKLIQYLHGHTVTT